jgi:hypothetical protein
MKKVIFAAIAVCGFVASNAQNNLPVILPPAPAKTALQSDLSQIGVRLILDNVICMTPGRTEGTAQFRSVHDFKEGQQVSEDGVILAGSRGLFDFKVSSNRNYNVTVQPQSQYFTGSGGSGATAASSNMPVSVLSWKLAHNETGGSGAPGATSWTPFGWGANGATVSPVINGGLRGYEKEFSLDMKANPGFNYNGGNYDVNILVTATQL